MTLTIFGIPLDEIIIFAAIALVLISVGLMFAQLAQLDKEQRMLDAKILGLANMINIAKIPKDPSPDPEWKSPITTSFASSPAPTPAPTPTPNPPAPAPPAAAPEPKEETIEERVNRISKRQAELDQESEIINKEKQVVRGRIYDSLQNLNTKKKNRKEAPGPSAPAPTTPNPVPTPDSSNLEIHPEPEKPNPKFEFIHPSERKGSQSESPVPVQTENQEDKGPEVKPEEEDTKQLIEKVAKKRSKNSKIEQMMELKQKG